MSDQSRKQAVQLAHEIFPRTMSAWNAVYTFRWMGQLGLPHAKNQAGWQHERTFQHLASADEYAPMFRVDRQTLVDSGYFEEVTKATTEQSVATFESALDAASLIFAHSVLDSTAFDWCRVCALAQPEDFIPYVEQKKVTLSKVQEAGSFSDILNTAIDGYLKTLERESLIKKLDLLFALCRPSRDFVGIEKYRYDRDRIVALDNLRHDYVHRGGLGGRLPQGDDDLWFLWKTTNFLLPLVLLRYGIRLDPNDMAAALVPRGGENLAPPSADLKTAE
jgi:hypothetical protein